MKKVAFLTLLIHLLLSLSLQAVPSLINYQGVALGSDGNALAAGNYTIQFRLYDVATGGSALWAESQIVKVVSGGRFNVLLGTGSVVPGEPRPDISTAFAGDERYLGVKIGTNPEFNPRQRIVSNAFAFKAATVETISPAQVALSNMAAGSVGNGQLLDGAVTNSKLSDNSVSANKIADDAVGHTEIANNAVGNGELADNAVSANKIADDAVGSSEIADNAVGHTEIADNAVGSSEIADNAVGSSEIADNAVGLSEMADNAVGTAEVIDNNLTANDLADNSVGAAELADNAVDTAAIQNGAVTIAKIDKSVSMFLIDKYAILTPLGATDTPIVDRNGYLPASVEIINVVGVPFSFDIDFTGNPQVWHIIITNNNITAIQTVVEVLWIHKDLTNRSETYWNE